MRNPNRSRLIAGAITFLASTALFLAVPDRPHAATSSCNGTNTGKVCWQNESCVNILFYKQCTTTYKYYEAAGGSGGGESPCTGLAVGYNDGDALRGGRSVHQTSRMDRGRE